MLDWRKVVGLGIIVGTLLLFLGVYTIVLSLDIGQLLIQYDGDPSQEGINSYVAQEGTIARVT